MKSLLPSLKEKKRYLVFEAIPVNSKLNIKQSLLNSVMTKIKNLLGVFESAKAGIMPIEFNKSTNKGIIRVNNQYVDKVKSTLLFINEIESQQVIIRSVGISGMINKAKTKFKAAE